MIIELRKFGGTLVSRQSGREAFMAFQPTLYLVGPSEDIEVSFEGILTLSPAWADEFLTPLENQFKERFILLPSINPSVQITLEILAEGKQKRG